MKLFVKFAMKDEESTYIYASVLRMSQRFLPRVGNAVPW